MENLNVKKLLPHLIAIAVFLLVTIIFCKPALEPGVVMQQSDVTQSHGMIQQSKQYREIHGVYPIWVTSMFGGMPAYNILFEGAYSPLYTVDHFFQLWLPKPLNFFFLSCISFYFLCICLRIRPYIAIMGSLAFAFSSYNPILAAAGHDTKLLALAYAPALIGGIILIYEKKYISGFVLTALFATMHLMQNHPQINYYTIIIIGIMTIFYAARWIKEKDIKRLLKAIPLAVVGGLIGVMINAILLLPVMDYAKYSKRGGQLVMDTKTTSKSDVVDKDKTKGLSRDCLDSVQANRRNSGGAAVGGSGHHGRSGAMCRGCARRADAETRDCGARCVGEQQRRFVGRAPYHVQGGRMGQGL